MKPYEKPRLVALSLSGNNMLCSGCAVTTRNGIPAQIFDWLSENGYSSWDTNGNGIFDYGDNITGLFGVGIECGDGGVIGYCKFTASENGMSQLFTS